MSICRSLCTGTDPLSSEAEGKSIYRFSCLFKDYTCNDKILLELPRQVRSSGETLKENASDRQRTSDYRWTWLVTLSYTVRQ